MFTIWTDFKLGTKVQNYIGHNCDDLSVLDLDERSRSHAQVYRDGAIELLMLLKSFVFKVSSKAVSCDITGTWTTPGECVQHYFTPGPKLDSRSFYFPFTALGITSGWKICLTGSTHSDSSGVTFTARSKGDRVFFYAVRDEDEPYDTRYNLYNAAGTKLVSYDSPKVDLKGIADFRINLTLVQFTQFRVDISPIGHTETSPLYSGNALTEIDEIDLSGGLTISSFDIDC